ncbi:MULTISPECIES: hypothetical protein [unclassified Rathayibacter]|uniref:hypothetical protein n=1 Tax=unclassified Rathayibacter TaxID=2609250 RepID=UPI001FB469B1|nr:MULTISPECIES: hypothetical protein [unclassified Rathayibacter]MCJ1673495.1 hypothetical protein [Rathayibacter sp. VKM Ac-2929]MCJ1681616.1 hypothetical protein [Rathayibacter sp. VKM Ac-2928]
MRARAVGTGAALLVAAGLLAGCTAAEPEASGTASATASATPPASTSASPTPSRSSAARLGCDALLPVARASSALGVAAGSLEGTRDETVRSSAELIRESAQENGGLLTCAWYEEDGTASITASAAEDAADAFAAAGLSGGTRLATDVEAYSACSVEICSVDLLTGSTWVTLALTGSPADADLAALATATAAAAGGRLDEPVTATAPACAEVLTGEQLAATAGLVDATPGSGTEGVAPSTASGAAAARAGYASCTWTDATSSSYAGLSVDVLPNGEDGWRNLSLTTGLAVTLTPLDGLGDRALSGCGGGSCEVDVLADDTWWRVLVTGDAARAESVARAVIAG